MTQWLWVLFIEEYNGRRSIINAGLVAAENEEDAKQKAQERIGYNLMPGMAINVTDKPMDMTVGQLMAKKTT